MHCVYAEREVITYNVLLGIYDVRIMLLITCGLPSGMETENWPVTLSVKEWTTLDLVSTSCTKRYR